MGRRGFRLGKTCVPVSAPSHPNRPKRGDAPTGVRQAGIDAFLHSKAMARLSHPYHHLPPPPKNAQQEEEQVNKVQVKRQRAHHTNGAHHLVLRLAGHGRAIGHLLNLLAVIHNQPHKNQHPGIGDDPIERIAEEKDVDNGSQNQPQQAKEQDWPPARQVLFGGQPYHCQQHKDHGRNPKRKKYRIAGIDDEYGRQPHPH